MKKLLIIAIVALMSASCMKNTYNKFSWSKTVVGTMTTTNTATGVPYVNTQQRVGIEMEDAFVSVVNFYLLDVKFVEMMPAQPEIKMADVPFTVSTNEDMPANSWIVNVSSIVPTIGGVPYEQYTMTGVHGLITDDFIDLSFSIEVGGTPYTVTFTSRPALPEEE